MTEQPIAAVFAEFRRIGLDPDSISAPLIVTGFTRRSLIDWLRQIPTAVGPEELDRRLAAHARDALARAEAAGAPAERDPQRVEATPNEGEVRWWPTTLVLDAGIQMMAEEWDPIGMKIGSVLPEDLGEYTLQLFGPLLHRWPYGERLEQTATVLASIEGSLGLRASPEIHRRYLAARLREILATGPLPVREAGRNDVSTDSDRPSPKPFGLDPKQSASSRPWHDVVDFVRVVLHARNDPERGAEITDDLLAQLASEIATDAGGMDGPMPDEIDVFLREFAPSR